MRMAWGVPVAASFPEGTPLLLAKYLYGALNPEGVDRDAGRDRRQFVNRIGEALVNSLMKEF